MRKYIRAARMGPLAPLLQKSGIELIRFLAHYIALLVGTTDVEMWNCFLAMTA